MAPAPARPDVLVFDVNETLSDMSAMRARFSDVGAPEHLAALWFATLLRDGFALAAAGSSERFAVLADGVLRSVLAGLDPDRDVDGAVEHVMSGFGQLDVHPDVPDGLRRLRAGGARLVTLSNGGTSVTEGLLTRAGVRDELEAVLSVEDAGVWKPDPGSYRYAATTCGTDLAAMMLVAVHPWDCDGAARAGMRSAWVNRTGATYPSYFTPPEVEATSLATLADAVGA